MKYGTPQGSCLGPLIFLVFVNDLHLHLRESECVQFADDTTLVLSHQSIQYLRFIVENELSVVQDWFNANKLTLKTLIRACTYCTIHRNQAVPTFKILLNDIEIPRVKYAKFLGVWMDDQLKWDIHINKLLTKPECGIGMLKCSKHLLSPKAKKLLYFGQIHSNLCYSLCIWGSMLQSQMGCKIITAQEMAIKTHRPNLEPR